MEDCYGSFGYGSRTCLGKNMGLMELSRVRPITRLESSTGGHLQGLILTRSLSLFSLSRPYSETMRSKFVTHRSPGSSSPRGSASRRTFMCDCAPEELLMGLFLIRHNLEKNASFCRTCISRYFKMETYNL